MGEISLSPRHGKEFKKRVYYLLSFFIFAMLILLFRIGYLQIVRGDDYSALSRGNSEQAEPQFPKRGEVLDRNGLSIIKNMRNYAVALTVGFVKEKQRKKVKQRLSELFDISVKKINRIIKRKEKRDRNINTPVIIKRDVDINKIIKIRENFEKYPGVSVLVRSRRIYAKGEDLAHIIGYIRAISESDYKRVKSTGRYRPISDIGKLGIERVYDLELRGYDGQIVKLVDAYSRPIQEIEAKRKSPIPGKTLVLNIDVNLQELAYTALNGRRGAVIVTKPHTGEVLALVSSPSFNSNMFFGNPKLRKEYAKLKDHPDKPLFNRALAGFYPPGSTFKIVTASAALNENRISENTSFTCTGKYELGDRIFRCFAVHGRLNLFEAIKRSCTYYFYRVGELVGYELIYKYARLYNFGKTTGIDLTGERGGNVPNNRWKINRFGEKWYEGDTLNMAIGQGYLMVTPLQVHNIISTIANDGILMQPHVLKKIKNPRTGTVEKVIYPKVLKNRFLKLEVIKFIQGALREGSKKGTSAWVATIAPKVQIAGKTGTAQNPFGAPHAWFTSFGGYDLPLDQRVAITVLVENQEAGGGAVSAPIAAILYNYIYQVKSKEQCLKDMKSILNINIIRRYSDATETSPASPARAHDHYNNVEVRRVREYHRDLQRNPVRQQGEGDDENIED